MKNYNPRLRTLITSGAGFLESHLYKRFLNGGHEILCLYNFFTETKDYITNRLNHPCSELIYNALLVDDTKQHQPDITLAKNMFLEVGLKPRIEYFDELLNGGAV